MENSPGILDSTEEFKRALNLKIEAKRDNINVYFQRVNGVMMYRVNKCPYSGFLGAFNHVKFLQSLLAPSREVRS